MSDRLDLGPRCIGASPDGPCDDERCEAHGPVEAATRPVSPPESLTRYKLEPYATDALVPDPEGEWVPYLDAARAQDETGLRVSGTPFGPGSSSCNVAHFDANGQAIACPDAVSGSAGMSEPPRPPRTEAGKALYASKMRPTRATILAIEEQAATEARAEAIQGQLDDISEIVAAKVTEARRELARGVSAGMTLRLIAGNTDQTYTPNEVAKMVAEVVDQQVARREA